MTGTNIVKETTRRRDVLLLVVGTSLVKETARQRDVLLSVVAIYHETKRCIVACGGDIYKKETARRRDDYCL